MTQEGCYLVLVKVDVEIIDSQFGIVVFLGQITDRNAHREVAGLWFEQIGRVFSSSLAVAMATRWRRVISHDSRLIRVCERETMAKYRPWAAFSSPFKP